MIQLHSSLMYLLIFTAVAGLIAYRIVVRAYDVTYAEYQVVETVRVAR